MKKYFSRSIERAIRLLNTLSETNTPLNLTEISKMSGLNKSTVFRILSDLQNELFISKNDSTNKYFLGVGLLSLGRAVRENDELRNIALPYMKELNKESEESIELCVSVDTYRIPIEKVESPFVIRHTIDLGKRVPLYCGAGSKAILSFSKREKINEVIYKNKLTAITPGTIIDTDLLEKEIETIRKQKFAISQGEFVLNSASIAVPILNFDNTAIGCLSINMPHFRFSKKMLTKFAPILIEIGKKISKELGYKNN